MRRNGRRIRIREQPGTPGFAKAYGAAVEALAEPAAADGRPRPAATAARGTLGWLAAKYFASDEFLSLDPESQLTRRRPHTDADPDPMRNCPLQFMTSKKVKRLRDLKAGLPGAANNRRKYLSAMFGWAIEAEHMKSNPARDVRRKKYATNGFYTWTDSDLTAFENRHPIGSKARLALSLLLYLGVRKGDVVRLGPQNVHARAEHNVIKFTPNKTATSASSNPKSRSCPSLRRSLQRAPAARPPSSKPNTASRSPPRASAAGSATDAMRPGYRSARPTGCARSPPPCAPRRARPSIS